MVRRPLHLGMRASLAAWVALSAGAAFAAAPAPPSPDDRWLAQWAQEKLGSAAKDGSYATLAKELEEAMLARVACASIENLSSLTEVLHCWRACRFLPEAEALPGGERGHPFAPWLLAQHGVTRPLFRALGDLKAPREGLARLQELAAADEKAVLEYPDLAVAFATAVPETCYRPQPHAASLVESFLWYARPQIRLHYDLHQLPYEALRYLAETRLSVEERKWVGKKYARAAVPNPYFDIAYDEDAFFKGKAKKIDGLDYSLPNLAKVGGMCFDEAYYASEVCKALGIPAAVVYGRGGTGVPHSWYAYLRFSGPQQAAWDAQSGRYQQHLYFSGLVREPASEEKIPDSVLSLHGWALHYPLARREAADTAVTLARLVAEALKKGRAAGTEGLLASAAEYTNRGGPNRPPVTREWIGPARALDLALVEGLLTQAIQLNLAHAPAWDCVLELRQAEVLPAGHVERFLDTLIAQTAVSHPDYSFLWIMRVLPMLPDPAARAKIYQRAQQVYQARPDLQGRMLIAKGDDCREQQEPEKALAAYQDAALRSVAVAEIVVKAAAKAEETLDVLKRRGEAVQLYERLFHDTRKEYNAGMFRNQTSHYQLGLRLVALLREAGKLDAAKLVERQMQ